MTSLADTLRLQLLSGPLTARQLIENMAISQPTLSRELAKLGDEVVRIGAARSIQYALRDSVRGLPDIAVYRVDEAGCLHPQGTLLPVRPAGFVLRLENGQTRHSDGLPWWLADMRPQGYLGRAYAARHSAALGLPTRLSDWNDSHALRALLAHGHDAVGNWLLGEEARAQFLSAAAPQPVAEDALAEHYARLAQAAAQGESPGSSAGGEQPKFTCYRQSEDGPRAVLVKFSEAENSPVSERWRDLLLAEHLALATLRDAGVAAAAKPGAGLRRATLSGSGTLRPRGRTGPPRPVLAGGVECRICRTRHAAAGPCSPSAWPPSATSRRQPRKPPPCCGPSTA